MGRSCEENTMFISKNRERMTLEKVITLRNNRAYITKVYSLREALKRGLETIQYKEIIKRDSVICIKVNLCDVFPKRGVITPPDIVYEVVSFLRDRVAQAYVVESDGLLYSADEAAKKSGILDAVKRAGAIFINLSKDEKVRVKFKDTMYVRKLAMPKTLLRSEVFITMPVPKTHEITTYTGALKNQFGCYPQRNRVLLHPHLDEAIVDINKILKPQIAIMDARVGIEGNGPTRGFPVKLGLLLISNNVVLCDSIMTHIMNLPVNLISHLILAWKAGLGPLLPKKVLNNELKLLSIKRSFKLPYKDLGVLFQRVTLTNPITVRLFYNTPIIKCIVKIGRILRRFTLYGRTHYF